MNINVIFWEKKFFIFLTLDLIFKTKKISSDRNNFLFSEIITFNSTKHIIKPKVSVRNQKYKGSPLGIFSDIGFKPKPHSLILSFVESSLDISKDKKK